MSSPVCECNGYETTCNRRLDITIEEWYRLTYGKWYSSVRNTHVAHPDHTDEDLSAGVPADMYRVVVLERTDRYVVYRMEEVEIQVNTGGAVK